MIYTFYSYKGGVGRSMAVANVAEWFYQQGLRVLMIDWDLEAPGLESFFVPPDEVEKVRAKSGLIDMLLAYKDQYPLLPLTAPLGVQAAAAAAPASFKQSKSNDLTSSVANTFLWGTTSEYGREKLPQGQQVLPARKLDTLNAVKIMEENLPPLTYFLYPLRPETTTPRGDKQSLMFLSAGWRTRERFSEYGREVQNFSWSEFYAAYHGEAYFEWLRAQLNSTDMADVVLIDSRTGLTEMGGVCTRQLADVVVSLTAPNIQNLSGVAAMTASFKRQEVIDARNNLDGRMSERPLEVIVVPTRVENSEQDMRADFQEEFVKRFSDLPASFRIVKRTFWQLLIPYIPKYAYREKLAIGDPRGAEDLQKAYKTLTAHLALLAPEDGPIRARFADELRREFGTLTPRILLSPGTDGQRIDTSALRRQLVEAGLSVWGANTEDSESTEPAFRIGNVDLAEFLVLPVTLEGIRTDGFRKLWRYARQQGVCVQLIQGDPAHEVSNENLPAWLRNVHVYHPEKEIRELIDVLRRPCITSRIPFMAPDLPVNYVSRRPELEKLIAALLSPAEGKSSTELANGARIDAPQQNSNKRNSFLALVGPAGSGKTVLAQAACHDDRVIAAFADGIIWVTLGEKSNRASAMSLIHSALTGESSPPASGIERMVAAKLDGKNCLLVVNDVCDDSDIKPFVDLAISGKILFTTRDQNVAKAVGAERLVLGEMTSTEAFELFVKQSTISPDQASILNQIIDYMGKSPLALKLAGSALKQRLADSESHDALVDLFEDLRKTGVTAFDQKNTSERELSVSRSVTVTLDKLNDRQRDCFLKLVVVPPETEVPLKLLETLWQQEALESQKLARSFDALSLLKYDEAKNTILLSRLMHSFLEAQRADPSLLNAKIENAESIFNTLTPAEQTLGRRVLTRLVHLAEAGETLPDTRRSYDLEKFDSAARSVIETLQKGGVLIVASASSGDGSIVQLADDSVIEWSRLQRWLSSDRAFLIWRQALEPRIAEWEASKGHNREVLLRGKALATAHPWLRQKPEDLNEAEKLFLAESDRVQRLRQRTVRRTLAGFVLLVLVLTGAAYWQYRQARQRQQDALKSLSDARIRNIGDPVESPDVSYRRAIAAYDKVIAENPQFAEAYEGRGSVYVALGDYDNAEKDYGKALELLPDYVEAMKDLAGVYKLKGDKAPPGSAAPFYDQAIEQFGQAIRRKPDFVAAYFGRGDTYTAKGDKGDKTSYDLAIADYTRIIVQFQRDKPGADAYYKRGLAYKSKGDNPNALADFQKASELPGDDVTRENIKKNLQQLIVSAPSPTAAAAPIIFIQYNDPDDEDVLSNVANDLRSKGFKVVGGPQLSAGTAIGNGDVRCFNTTDFGNATKIASIVQESLAKQGYDKTIQSRDLKGYPNVPPGQIELWVASLRISKVQP